MTTRRRLLIQLLNDSNPECVTSYTNPCAFDSTSGRNTVPFAYGTIESGKTYKIKLNVTINITSKAGTADMYFKKYNAFGNASIRKYNPSEGITELNTEIEATARTAITNGTILLLDTTNIAGTITVTELSIKEV